MATVPVAEGVFTWPSDEHHLIGSRCMNCGTHAFPAQGGCAKCTGTETEQVELARRGTLWTWTVQGFPPKSPPYVGDTSPEGFRPFGVGYIELAGQVRVESRLTESDPAKLEIGMEMEMVIETLGQDDDGNDLVTYAFAPVAEGASA